MKGIDGWFSEDEGRWYARFARGLHGGTLVEVGSWKGRSTSFVGPVCMANGTRLVCVDHWRIFWLSREMSPGQAPGA